MFLFRKCFEDEKSIESKVLYNDAILTCFKKQESEFQFLQETPSADAKRKLMKYFL